MCMVHSSCKLTASCMHMFDIAHANTPVYAVMSKELFLP